MLVYRPQGGFPCGIVILSFHAQLGACNSGNDVFTLVLRVYCAYGIAAHLFLQQARVLVLIIHSL